MGKTRYRVRNWSQYNKSLVARGDLTIWLSDDIWKTWSKPIKQTGPGRRYQYNRQVIEFCLFVRHSLCLPYRQTQGFLQGLFKLSRIHRPVPSFGTLCRRAKNTETRKFRARSKTHVAIDSTGLKVYGEGEWLARKHGLSKRRTWKKLHITVNVDTHEIVTSSMTGAFDADCVSIPDLFKSGMETVYADGAYDSEAVRSLIERSDGYPLIPPRKGAKLGPVPVCKPESPRDTAILTRELFGDDWRKITGYGKRSSVEGAFSRYKRTFNGSLSCRSFERQLNEVRFKIAILNKFQRLGMPKTEIID